MEKRKLLVVIAGRGLMATACRRIDRDDILFFASGVSDSGETRKDQFDREERLLASYLGCKDKTFVYFGTSIDSNSLYALHKKKMCDMVATHENHIILRLSQVVGKGGNANNLFNSLFVSLLHGEAIKAYPVQRSLIDIDDVILLLEYLINNQLYGDHSLFKIDPLPVKDIIMMMAKEMGVNANIIEVKGENREMPPNTTIVNMLVEPLRNNYTKNVIKKYI